MKNLKRAPICCVSAGKCTAYSSRRRAASTRPLKQPKMAPNHPGPPAPPSSSGPESPLLPRGIHRTTTGSRGGAAGALQAGRRPTGRSAHRDAVGARRLLGVARVEQRAVPVAASRRAVVLPTAATARWGRYSWLGRDDGGRRTDKGHRGRWGGEADGGSGEQRAITLLFLFAG
jgi:hypothetical protein